MLRYNSQAPCVCKQNLPCIANITGFFSWESSYVFLQKVTLLLLYLFQKSGCNILLFFLTKSDGCYFLQKKVMGCVIPLPWTAAAPTHPPLWGTASPRTEGETCPTKISRPRPRPRLLRRRRQVGWRRRVGSRLTSTRGSRPRGKGCCRYCY